jgi:hypothetical protein
MGRIVIGVWLLAAAFLVVAFRKICARQCIEWQNKSWGFHFGERSIRASEVVITAFGILWIIFALLLLLGIIQPKGL